MKRILYIGDTNSVHDRKWISWFAEQDAYRCFLLMRDKHKPGEKLNNVEILGGISDYSVFKPWENKGSILKIQSVCKEKKIDVVHIFYAEPNLLWALTLSKKVKIILTTRGSDILVGLDHFISNKNWKNRQIIRAYQKALLRCDEIISTSQKQRDYLETHFKLDANLSIIRTGINIDGIIERKLIPNTIFFPRVMEPIYDHIFAIKALRSTSSEVKRKFSFTFIGKNGKNRKYIEEVKHEISECTGCTIHFLDLLDQEEYFNILSKSKTVVMTPVSDGSPVSGMEAIAAGCILILPDIEYDEDLFSSAIKYIPRDPSSLSDAIEKSIHMDNPKIHSDYIKLVDRNEEMTKLATLYHD